MQRYEAARHKLGQGTIDPMNSLSKDVIAYAKIRFETVVRLYYVRHSFDSCDPTFVQWLSTLGYLTLESLGNGIDTLDPNSVPAKTLRSTLLLCTIGVHSQGQSYYLYKLAYRVLRSRRARTIWLC